MPTRTPNALGIRPASDTRSVTSAAARTAAGTNSSTAVWPVAGPTSRLDPIADPRYRLSFSIPPGARVFTVGSCFARNIEQHLELAGFDVPIARYRVPSDEWSGMRHSGVLNAYTPASITQMIRLGHAVAEAEGQVPPEVIEVGLVEVGPDRVIDTFLASFQPVTRARARARRAEWSRLMSGVFDCDLLIVTLGLIECWLDADADHFIARSPNRALLDAHPSRFRFTVQPFSQALALMEDAIQCVLTCGAPRTRILLSTSPVPMGRSFTGEDVLIANTHSKSVLRAVAGELTARHDRVDYFPSYERVVLSRHPSVWEPDLRHVRHPFVSKIIDSAVTSLLPADLPAPARVLAEAAWLQGHIGNGARPEAWPLESGDRWRLMGAVRLASTVPEGTPGADFLHVVWQASMGDGRDMEARVLRLMRRPAWFALAAAACLVAAGMPGPAAPLAKAALGREECRIPGLRLLIDCLEACGQAADALGLLEALAEVERRLVETHAGPQRALQARERLLPVLRRWQVLAAQVGEPGSSARASAALAELETDGADRNPSR